MRRFMFRCPVTGYIVQGVADDPKPGDSPHIYQSVQCTACEGSTLSTRPPARSLLVRGRNQARERSGRLCCYCRRATEAATEISGSAQAR
jgi:hypothetical protein